VRSETSGEEMIFNDLRKINALMSFRHAGHTILVVLTVPTSLLRNTKLVQSWIRLVSLHFHLTFRNKTTSKTFT
jgi:hypothetical protein